MAKCPSRSRCKAERSSREQESRGGIAASKCGPDEKGVGIDAHPFGDVNSLLDLFYCMDAFSLLPFVIPCVSDVPAHQLNADNAHEETGEADRSAPT
jgi:hypothetical protein